MSDFEDEENMLKNIIRGLDPRTMSQKDQYWLLYYVVFIEIEQLNIEPLYTKLNRTVPVNEEALKLDLFEVLMEMGVSPSSENSKILTELLGDRWNCCIPHIKLAIKYGADVNAMNYWGNTQLIAAIDCYGGELINPEAIELLLKKGAEVNTIAPCGYTALTCLIYMYDAYYEPKFDDEFDYYYKGGEYNFSGILCEMVKLLMEYGADPFLKDNYNKCAIDYAIEIENEAIRKKVLTLMNAYRQIPPKRKVSEICNLEESNKKQKC